ncbi:gliding motility-associated C-terminal domain-containing protein [Sediminibacterium roseum]|uniref:Gliding motility-associated C-terminal domain-containing protein n=1 Tax=Sediminibacterium roseum TaxID=1978412 RepID=A0ABW9ZZE4_9BACT|nr:gliding motility-associated C-terminal domain-containing protein [Sediminibacterium roseum]NCI50360.1 gliding motility-associated C-terminal domain-containing protein [Sediminibacterium roseum]
MNQLLRRYRKLLVIHTLLLLSFHGFSQCPVNIGFETGTFDGWVCSKGNIVANPGQGIGEISMIPGPPDDTLHMIKKATTPQLLDRYGQFPVTCPNGSEYSIKLGNEISGRKAQQVSYTFTIPANDDNYSIIYNYAVVFQNPPDHREYEQPRFTANVFDVSDNKYIDCSSFSYAAFGDLNALGFNLSALGKDVFYKGWTPVTIKLSGYAGKTIRIEFTSNDCTKAGHFGYAYIDVNQNCSSPISGNTHCFNDTIQTLIAPFGFAGYRWFNGDFSAEIGDQPSLTLKPLPASGTKYAVEITPFPNQGCVDTVYTNIVYSSEVIDLKTPKNEWISCISKPVDLTSGVFVAGSSPGLEFSYFSDAALKEYLLTPKSILTTGTYYIKATNAVGCIASQPVKVKVGDFPGFSIKDPPPVRRPKDLDLTTLATGDVTGVSFSYWKDSLATIPILNPERVFIAGRYFIKATIEGGCSQVYGVNVDIGEALITPPNAFSPNGDAINDTWEIPLLASLYPDCVVEIFNRLGQPVFRSVGYGKTWDGRFKGIDQPVGTYYYVIKPRSDLPPIGGSVTIVR